jgi:DNA-binding MarR family transcriptional regulator
VVDRLEAAGLVSRQRDPADRRRVVVSIVINEATRQVAPIFASMVADWQQLTARYTDDEFRLIVEFYGQLEQVIRKHIDRLREPPPPADGNAA